MGKPILRKIRGTHAKIIHRKSMFDKNTGEAMQELVMGKPMLENIAIEKHNFNKSTGEPTLGNVGKRN